MRAPLASALVLAVGCGVLAGCGSDGGSTSTGSVAATTTPTVIVNRDPDLPTTDSGAFTASQSVADSPAADSTQPSTPKFAVVLAPGESPRQVLVATSDATDPDTGKLTDVAQTLPLTKSAKITEVPSVTPTKPLAAGDYWYQAVLHDVIHDADLVTEPVHFTVK